MSAQDLSSKLNEFMRTSVDAKVGNESRGIVLKADEFNNICHLFYQKENGVWGYDDIEVKISDYRGESWFPSIGQFVNVSFFDNSAYITGECVLNSNDIKKILKTPFDIWPSLNCSIGEGIG